MKRLFLVVVLLAVNAFAQKTNGPSVSITSPANGASFNAPATITISATASDTNGTITAVKFFENGTIIGSVKSTPYNFVWPSVPAGSYSLTATATDNLGQTATSAAVNITVSGGGTPDFSLAVSPTAITVPQGGSNSATVTVTSVNSFSSATSLSVSSLPSGVTASFSSSSVTPPAGGSANSTLTLSASSSAAPGTYTVVVTGTSGSLTHSTNLSLTVNSTVQPNYVGYVDHLGCDTIAGWAADRNRLNTSINVEIYDGTTLIQTVLANVSRPDVGSALGDNGLHGYNITTLSHFIDGQAHQVHVKFETSAMELTNSPASLTCPAGTGPIQGYKIDANGAVFNSPGATITIDGSQSFGPSVNPYGQTVTVGSHTVTSSTPVGFAVSYSLCNNCTDHSVAGGHPFVAGTSVTVNVTSGGYADLWWKYTAAPVDFSTARVDPSNRTGLPREDLLSGNYNWSLPVAGLKGRGGLDLGLALTYNSLVWTKAGSSIEFDADRGFPGPGFRLGFPAIEPKFVDSIVGVNAYLLIMPTGARVEVRQVGTTNTYESADSSYIQIVDNGSAGLLVRTPNGTQLIYQLIAGEYRCTQVEDRNGNFITANYNSFGHISNVVDTLGRTITFNYDASQLNLLQSITQTWNGTTHTWASFTYGSVTLQTNFTGLTLVGAQNGQSINVPTQITLADGSYFTFQYTSWGQVFKITRFAADNHELSHVSYDLPPTASGAQTDCPRFTQRRDSAENWNGGAEAITSYIFDPVNLTGGQATTPDGTQYKETYGTSTWQRGLTIQTQVLSGGVVKKTTTTSYTQDDTTQVFKLNPRVIETNVTDEAGNRRRVTTAYNTLCTLPSGAECSLPSDVSEYAADAATVLRRTHTDYNLGSAYLNARILGLPATVSVFDGNNVLASQVGYQYDAGVQNQGAAVQHDETNFGSAFVVGRGNLTSVQRFNALNTAQSLQSSIAYNTVGNAITATDPAGHQVTISYADSFSLGQPIGLTLAYPTSLTDADGFVSSTQYHYDTGAITLTQDPKGAQQIYSYDSAGRLMQQTYHDSVNNLNGTNTTYSYPASSNQIQTSTLLDPGLFATSTQFLDGAGRVFQAMRNFPGSTGGFSTEQSVYDVMGRPAQDSNQTETDANGTPTGDDASTRFLFSIQQYDWAGRPTVSTNPDGSGSSVSYLGCGCAGGLVTTETDEVGRQTRTTYDILGRPIKVEVLNFNGTVYKTTIRVFDALDHVTSISEQQGTAGTSVITTRTYDGYGRLASAHRPQQAPSASTVYTYYPDSTIQSITDGRGAIKNYTYNGRRQPTRITYTKPDGHTSPIELDFSYDSAGNRTQMIDNAGTVTYNYDTSSRLLQETRSFSDINSGATPFPLSYTYNLAGQLTSVLSPFGSTAGYVYDSSGQITTVTGSGFGHITQFASGIQYRAWGDPKHVNYGNGRVLDLTYDSKLQVSSSNLSLNDVTVMGYNYVYNADGSVHFAQDVVSRPFDRAYQYDQVSRITDAFSGNEARQFTVLSTPNGPYYEHMAYDEWDDLLQRSSRIWSVNAATFNASYANLLDTNWTYDNEGNVTLEQENQVSFSYDVADEPVTIVEPNVVIGRTTGITINQLFDGDEQLVAQGKVAGSNSFASHFVRSSVLGGRIVSEVNFQGLEDKTYIYQGSSEIAWNIPGSGIEWVHRSLTGSSYQTADNTGSLLQQVEFDPIGGRFALSDPGPIVLDTDRFDRTFPRVANVGDTAGGCIVDWVPVSCDYAQKVLSLGWGAIYNGPSVVWDPKNGPLIPQAPNGGPDSPGIVFSTLSGNVAAVYDPILQKPIPAGYDPVTRTIVRINPSDPRVTTTLDPNGTIHINVNDIQYSNAVVEYVNLATDPSGGGFLGGGQQSTKSPQQQDDSLFHAKTFNSDYAFKAFQQQLYKDCINKAQDDYWNSTIGNVALALGGAAIAGKGAAGGFGGGLSAAAGVHEQIKAELERNDAIEKCNTKYPDVEHIDFKPYKPSWLMRKLFGF